MGDNPHVIEVAVEPRSRQDADRLAAALRQLAEREPSLRVWRDDESGQTILGGASEQQLEAVRAWLKEQDLALNVGAPQVAYRERLGIRADIDHTYKKQAGGYGEFARVKIAFEPGPPGSGFVFESVVVGGNVPEEFIPGVEKGLQSAKENGPRAGFPLVDFKATLYDGAYHDVDSTPLAFELAARGAFRQLRVKGAPHLIEPVMRLEVLAPADCLDDLIGDLTARGGRVESTEARAQERVVAAFAPLPNLWGYGSSLGALSEGRARFSMAFSHYAPVPGDGPEDDPPTFRPAMGMRA